MLPTITYQSGVYSITNTVNGKKYIGSSIHLKSRLQWHLSELRNGRHHSNKLLNAWLKDGEEAFAVTVELYCDTKDTVAYEQALIDFYSSATEGYNIRGVAESNRGLKYSEATKGKMRAYALNRPDAHNAKVSLANTGKVLTEEHRKALSEAHVGLTYRGRKRGYQLAEDHRLKIVQALIGRPVSERTRNNMREARAAGSTGVQGITWDSTREKYVVALRVGGIRKYIGRYSELEDAKTKLLEARATCS